MQTSNNLISQILAAAQAAGLSQKTLAERAGVKEETISRIKKRGTGNFGLIAQLAQVAGSPLTLVAPVGQRLAKAQRTSFRDKYAVQLAWSNKHVSDDVLIRRALIKPGFHLLLDAVIEFGIDRVATAWAQLKSERNDEVLRAEPITERLLKHIRHGYQQATR